MLTVFWWSGGPFHLDLMKAGILYPLQIAFLLIFFYLYIFIYDPT